MTPLKNFTDDPNQYRIGDGKVNGHDDTKEQDDRRRTDRFSLCWV